MSEDKTFPDPVFLRTVNYRDGTEGPIVGSLSRTALYDLTINDVAEPEHYRLAGHNPLRVGAGAPLYLKPAKGEHGLAIDEQVGARYSPLTYLLVEAGERSASDPGSPRRSNLTPEEHLKAWIQASKRGLLPNDDPVPWLGVFGAALDMGLVTEAELINDKKLYVPRMGTIRSDRGLRNDIYDQVLRNFRDKYGVAPGREPAVTEEHWQFEECTATDLLHAFPSLFLTSRPREHETPFSGPKERMANVWELFELLVSLNGLEELSPYDPHKQPKQLIVSKLPDAEKKSTTWYAGADSKPQLLVGARVNDVGRSIGLKYGIEFDDW